ncbi:TnsA-like heteromeric transposase endonuclease subunit [Streptomyces sp. NBC_00878]|uniref:TnsA-like heteromeric transposase endonuclease subunit n=1 Tax=Streptomyces sp. NBC_00878 TaxID=2975854 RepID=UPI00225BB319|nr:TnsA-like heteromeric transposase endonuclease subunit [Streptomyces sp. NBC_00878]MCX4905488.1 TnsA-like heteromeric transposase endonuclease subunit [Streptomyces sp. NBC_00878]
MLLDSDPSVVGISSQPFWLFWWSDADKGVPHAPDYFARRENGTALVVDCRPADRRKPRDVLRFEATQAACAQVGREFRLVGVPDAIVVRNVRRPAGYRQPRHRLEPVASELPAAFAEPQPVMGEASALGDPIRVLPVLFHLLWSHELTADVSVPPLPHHRYVRTRHSVWIGPPDADQPAVSLPGLPEIADAQPGGWPGGAARRSARRRPGSDRMVRQVTFLVHSFVRRQVGRTNTRVNSPLNACAELLKLQPSPRTAEGRGLAESGRS